MLAVLCVAAVVAAVPALGGAGAAKVAVTLKEFKLIPVPAKVKPGSVTFAVRNTGQLEHELVVLKTTTAPGKLPRQGAKAKEVGRVGKLAAVKPGKSGTLTLTLAAGKYVLLCNLPAHYGAGQYAGFTVG